MLEMIDTVTLNVEHCPDAHLGTGPRLIMDGGSQSLFLHQQLHRSQCTSFEPLSCPLNWL